MHRTGGIMDQNNDPIVIVSSVRTPIGHFGGFFKELFHY